jgi:predicted Rossmann-fold nucleotide-binding protein
MSNRRPVVGVMGAGDGASAEAMRLAEQLGEWISARGWALLTGGRPAGVMAAASRGAARTASEAAHALNAGRPLILLALPVVGGFVRWL